MIDQWNWSTGSRLLHVHYGGEPFSGATLIHAGLADGRGQKTLATFSLDGNSVVYGV